MPSFLSWSEIIEKFVYLGICMSAGGGMTDDITASSAYTHSDHLFGYYHKSMDVKVQVYNASERQILLYACKIWYR